MASNSVVANLIHGVKDQKKAAKKLSHYARVRRKNYGMRLDDISVAVIDINLKPKLMSRWNRIKKGLIQKFSKVRPFA